MAKKRTTKKKTSKVTSSRPRAKAGKKTGKKTGARAPRRPATARDGKRLVIAHFMHETEARAAESILPGAERTKAFFMGEADADHVAALRSAGLMVQELPAPPERAVPQGMPRVFGLMAMTDPGAREPSIPGLFVVELLGPVMPSWRAALEGIFVRLGDRMPREDEPWRSGYLVRIDRRAQLEQLGELPFVVGIAPVSGGSGASTGVSSARLVAGKKKTYDVLTTDVRGVAAWCKGHGGKVVAKSGRKLRVELAEGHKPALSALDGVTKVEPYVPPKLHLEHVRTGIGLGSGADLAVAPPFEGEGQLIAVADTGIDETHADFAGRIEEVVPLGRATGDDPDGHGTHVAGIVLGDGAASNGVQRGVAPKARLYFQSLLDRKGELGGLPLDLADLFGPAYDAGARIHNNSWGADVPGHYTLNSSEVDAFVHDKKDMLIVISAGNEGIAADPKLNRGSVVGWLSVCSPASSKNALVVGASRSPRKKGGWAEETYGGMWAPSFPKGWIATQKISGNAECLAGFSSRGPSDDYRIKPDLVAPGTDVLAPRSKKAKPSAFWRVAGPHYGYMGGTSMSAPVVAGAAALVREYFQKRRAHDPSAALLKATLVNGTRWLTGKCAVADNEGRPNYHQGFGCLNLPTTVPLANDFQLEFLDAWKAQNQVLQDTGDCWRFRLEVKKGTPLRVCLAYTDLPARGLQNNLDLLVEGPGSKKYLSNEGLPASLSPVVGDATNNVEIVHIEKPTAGKYLIQITATNLLRGPQDFALVVTGALGSALTNAH